ncbi:hypothetical protein ACFFLS_04785 [Flavobacterium procerum]|uniref:Uncharacterized protein n=1 Tax=Flavobacterium procerum TaxID=1455569 RepID=A0ABV6BLM0_9FLAO
MNPNKKPTTFIKIYVLISLLFATNCLLYYFASISLRGYYSDVVLFWFWLTTSFIVIIVYWKNILAKLLLASLLLTLAMSIIAMMIPFYALLNATTPLGLRTTREISPKYRAQIVEYSPMAPPSLEVIKTYGIVERRLFKNTSRQLLNDNMNVKINTATGIVFNSETNSTITLTLRYPGNQKAFTFNKSTGDIVQ